MSVLALFTTYTVVGSQYKKKNRGPHGTIYIQNTDTNPLE